uniref:ARAD1D41668p n=1 Tax=Blastobotrys adeninivorans TaxID=409370 RepID=A0A060TDA3_BLAAD
MNVLVYSGPGSTIESVRCCTDTLRRLLSPYYSVLTVNAAALSHQPWVSSTALVVMPGGADLPYCRELGGQGNEAIKKYVRQGGRYLGFCAGGYYGSSKVEFAKDTKLEVSGSRDLKFFPGTARGPAFEGFVYDGDDGVKACKLKVNKKSLGIKEDGLSSFLAYFNGGPCFVDAHKLAGTSTHPNLEILAEYEEVIDVDGGQEGESGAAAVIYNKVGKGHVILTGPHPEYGPGTLRVESKISSRKQQVISQLDDEEPKRLEFLRAILTKMGLKVNDGTGEAAIPRLTPLILSALHPARIQYIIDVLGKEVGFSGPDKDMLEGQNDTFRILRENDSKFVEAQLDKLTLGGDYEEDLNKVVKDVYAYTSGRPNGRDTPHFNHDVYYATLESSRTSDCSSDLGSVVLYGEVVTSTSTMLDKNYTILSHLPHGLISVGSVQVQGRGRGGNLWVNPHGVLAVSGVLRIPIQVLTGRSPIVFIQYIVSLAMVEAIRSYGIGYEELPVRIKWPNDIYILDPKADFSKDSEDPEKYVKIGGIIVNNNILSGEYVAVFGCGTNVSNAAPTTSLNTVLASMNEKREAQGKHKLEEIRHEILLAKFMVNLDRMMRDFSYQGFGALEDLYYRRWLHTGKTVTLEQHDNVKAVIQGISSDAGMLVVEEIDSIGRGTGIKYELQPDGNSFDMFRGLLKRK